MYPAVVHVPGVIDGIPHAALRLPLIRIGHFYAVPARAAGIAKRAAFDHVLHRRADIMKALVLWRKTHQEQLPLQCGFLHIVFYPLVLLYRYTTYCVQVYNNRKSE